MPNYIREIAIFCGLVFAISPNPIPNFFPIHETKDYLPAIYAGKNLYRAVKVPVPKSTTAPDMMKKPNAMRLDFLKSFILEYLDAANFPS